MTGQTIRIAFVDPYWHVQQQLTRYTRLHESSTFSTPDIAVEDWETRGIYDNFYTAVVETLQLAVEEETDIESIDYGYINPQSAFMQTIRSGIESLTL